MSEASAEKSSNEEAKASAGEELAATTKSVDSDTTTLATLRQDCSNKAKEWDARQKSAAGEIAAIEKAKEILADGVKVFLQVTAKSTVRGLIEAMIDRLTKQAAEEAEAKSFCDGEMHKSKAKQAELTASSDKHAARIEKASASKATLEQQTKQLQAEIAEMD